MNHSQFTATRDEGLARLDAFLPKAGRDYAARRNSDFGPGNHTAVSVLSPWVRHRLISEEEIVRETLKRHSFKASEKFVQEVFWRSYFKGWLEQRPEVWDRYCDTLNGALESLDGNAPYKRDYSAAISGNTGIECFDFWAKELVETGYLHNHARMWFASIWIFTLNLPWVLGADFFYRHLLDGDPASNTCSWRWVAGLHTKGKHYVARASNIQKFTNGRFNPVRELNENPLPLSEDFDAPQVPPPVASSWESNSGNPYILLVTDEDCMSPLGLAAQPPAAVVGANFTEARSSLECSEAVLKFSTDAVFDSLSRIETQFGCETRQSATNTLLETLSELAESHQTDRIIMPYLPVGSTRDAFKPIRMELEANGLNVHSALRPYDEACWPHTSRGFFKLKEKIPTIVSKLGLN